MITVTSLNSTVKVLVLTVWLFIRQTIGVEPTGLKAGQKAPFTVDAKGAGDGELDVFVEGPLGEEKIDIKNNGDGTYSCMYFPNKFGRYIVNVTWSSVQVPNSPFNVKVATAVDASKIKAYGPGLERGKLLEFLFLERSLHVQ